VELADGGVAGGAHLAVRPLVRRAHEVRGLMLGLRQHRLPPAPEVAARSRTAECTLERVAVGVDEAGQRESVSHGRRRYQGAVGGSLTTGALQPEAVVRLTVDFVISDELRRKIPNALTIVRFAAIPVFAWLYLEAGDGAAWGAGLFFAGAALTDQVDGYLARRWHVESRFGKVADPLADRLMIGTAVVLMWATGRMPIAAAAIILARDLVLILGYKVLAPRGFELDVTFLGKLATWILYAALGFLLVTEEGTTWPLVVLWVGIALALAAGAQYVLRARAALAQG
jgi:CDP-diacylglycerol--glycerol-3-phosphate 3-phosphatidyltransferase